jgi:hypothetical protein
VEAKVKGGLSTRETIIIKIIIIISSSSSSSRRQATRESTISLAKLLLKPRCCKTMRAAETAGMKLKRKTAVAAAVVAMVITITACLQSFTAVINS